MKTHLPPQVDVCVLALNNSDVSAFFLRHFVKTTRNIAYKIWMLDQASTDRTAGLMAWWKMNTRRWVPWARHKRVQYQGFRSDANIGFAQGNNFLAAMGTAPWILFINNDAFPRMEDYDWLVRLRNTAVLNDWAAVGPTSNRIMGLQDWKWNDEWPKTHPVKVLSGMCVLIRRDVFESIGWDTEFLNGDEDCALSIELRRRGYAIGCDRSVYLQHLCNTTMLDWCKERGETVKEHFYHTRQKLIAKFGVFFVRDLWEWQSLRVPKTEWPKLGVTRNGFLWHPSGKPSDTAACQGKLLARVDTPAQAPARQLHPRPADRGREVAGDSEGGTAAHQRGEQAHRRNEGARPAAGDLRAGRTAPKRARSGIQLQCKVIRSEEHSGATSGLGRRAVADAARSEREGALARAAGLSADGFEHHFAGGPLGFAQAVRKKGSPCPYDGTSFFCACQAEKEVLAGVS